MTESLSDFVNQVTRVVREVERGGLLCGQENATNVSGTWKVRPCPFRKLPSTELISLNPELDGPCELDGS